MYVPITRRCASRLSQYKKTVDHKLPEHVTNERIFGDYYKVKEVGEKISKDKRYQAFEIHSVKHAELLRTAAGEIKDWGAFPGVFVKSKETGKPVNIRFSDAKTDYELLNSLWLMVFVHTHDHDRFKESTPAILQSALRKYITELSLLEENEICTLEYIETNPEFKFSPKNSEPAAIYKLTGTVPEVLYSAAMLLFKKGYSSGLVTKDDDGKDVHPHIMTAIPTSNDEKLSSFPDVVKQVSKSALATYKDVLSKGVETNF